jgi:hypothetical protein
MNDLVAIEEIAQWKKPKAVVLDFSHRDSCLLVHAQHESPVLAQRTGIGWPDELEALRQLRINRLHEALRRNLVTRVSPVTSDDHAHHGGVSPTNCDSKVANKILPKGTSQSRLLPLIPPEHEQRVLPLFEHHLFRANRKGRAPIESHSRQPELHFLL